jgi:hypothetical protein
VTVNIGGLVVNELVGSGLQAICLPTAPYNAARKRTRCGHDGVTGADQRSDTD